MQKSNKSPPMKQDCLVKFCPKLATVTFQNQDKSEEYYCSEHAKEVEKIIKKGKKDENTN